jgi:hypothetical protein
MCLFFIINVLMYILHNHGLLGLILLNKLLICTCLEYKNNNVLHLLDHCGQLYQSIDTSYDFHFVTHHNHNQLFRLQFWLVLKL